MEQNLLNEIDKKYDNIKEFSAVLEKDIMYYFMIEYNHKEVLYGLNSYGEMIYVDNDSDIEKAKYHLLNQKLNSSIELAYTVIFKDDVSGLKIRTKKPNYPFIEAKEDTLESINDILAKIEDALKNDLMSLCKQKEDCFYTLKENAKTFMITPFSKYLVKMPSIKLELKEKLDETKIVNKVVSLEATQLYIPFYSEKYNEIIMPYYLMLREEDMMDILLLDTKYEDLPDAIISYFNKQKEIPSGIKLTNPALYQAFKDNILAIDFSMKPYNIEAFSNINQVTFYIFNENFKTIYEQGYITEESFYKALNKKNYVQKEVTTIIEKSKEDPTVIERLVELLLPEHLSENLEQLRTSLVMQNIFNNFIYFAAMTREHQEVYTTLRMLRGRDFVLEDPEEDLQENNLDEFIS